MNYDRSNFIGKYVKRGLYVNNLYDMARLCGTAKRKSNTVLFDVLEGIFYDLAHNWDERPLPESEVKSVESKILKPLLQLVEKVNVGSSEKELFQLLTDIILKYVHVCDEYTG